MKKEIKKKLKDYAWPILVGLIILLLSLTVFRSLLISLAQLRLENRLHQERLEKLTAKVHSLKKLNNQELKNQVEKVEGVFPSDSPFLKLLASLSRLAQEEGVVLDQVRLVSEETSADKEKSKDQPVSSAQRAVQTLLVDFTLEGELVKIASFVQRLDRTAPLAKVENFGFDLQKNRASFRVATYYQTLPEFLGKIDQPLVELSTQEKSVLETALSYQVVSQLPQTAVVGKENIFALSPLNLLPAD